MQQGIRVRVGAVIVRNSAIVLVEYDDEKSGRHFNLPGGGVNEGESLHDALRREVLEETCMIVEVGRLLLVWEYVPPCQAKKYGPRHEIAFVFHCKPHEGSEPRLPEVPDENQIATRWVPLEDLPHVPLLPQVGERLLATVYGVQEEDILYQGSL
jgi:ADP-ribose pyrophosphatase YjhB (NUDIX family)